MLFYCSVKLWGAGGSTGSFLWPQVKNCFPIKALARGSQLPESPFSLRGIHSSWDIFKLPKLWEGEKAISFFTCFYNAQAVGRREAPMDSQGRITEQRFRGTEETLLRLGTINPLSSQEL